MSFKKAKKKRMSVLFDLDNVKAGMAEQDSVFADIREHLFSSTSKSRHQTDDERERHGIATSGT
jgi:hypothetical protein